MFVIITSNTDKEVKDGIVCFVDDTRVSTMIKLDKNKEALQEDLNILHKWADENLMKVSEKNNLKIKYWKDWQYSGFTLKGANRKRN